LIFFCNPLFPLRERVRVGGREGLTDRRGIAIALKSDYLIIEIVSVQPSANAEESNGYSKMTDRWFVV
jgi:hypothetical protein